MDKKTIFKTVRMDEGLWQRIEAQATEEGISTSEMVRLLCERQLDKSVSGGDLLAEIREIRRILQEER